MTKQHCYDTLSVDANDIAFAINLNIGDLIMADLAPSASVTKLGSIAIILVIALVALWLANNVTFVSNLTARRNAA